MVMRSLSVRTVWTESQNPQFPKAFSVAIGFALGRDFCFSRIRSKEIRVSHENHLFLVSPRRGYRTYRGKGADGRFSWDAQYLQSAPDLGTGSMEGRRVCTGAEERTAEGVFQPEEADLTEEGHVGWWHRRLLRCRVPSNRVSSQRLFLPPPTPPARIIHERFCWNRRSAAATSLRAAGSPLGPSTYCTSTPRDLRPPRAALATRLRDFATNHHE